MQHLAFRYCNINLLMKCIFVLIISFIYWTLFYYAFAWSKKLKIETNFSPKIPKNLLSGEMTIGPTRKATQGTRSSSRWHNASVAFAIMTCLTKLTLYTVTNSTSLGPLLARLVYGSHWGNSFHIFDTSTFPVVTTPEIFLASSGLCLMLTNCWTFLGKYLSIFGPHIRILGYARFSQMSHIIYVHYTLTYI